MKTDNNFSERRLRPEIRDEIIEKLNAWPEHKKISQIDLLDLIEAISGYRPQSCSAFLRVGVNRKINDAFKQVIVRTESEKENLQGEIKNDDKRKIIEKLDAWPDKHPLNSNVLVNLIEAIVGHRYRFSQFMSAKCNRDLNEAYKRNKKRTDASYYLGCLQPQDVSKVIHSINSWPADKQINIRSVLRLIQEIRLIRLKRTWPHACPLFST